MDLADRLRDLSSRVERQSDNVASEEATKTAFVLPFLQALGYDVFNPNEIIPEFTADHGVKKGEKVDYAIKLDSQIMVLIECKPLGAQLDAKYAGQLFRYFGVTDARFAILTDGARYLFYSDLDRANRMDDRSFFEFNLLDFNEARVEELKQFTKSTFDLDNILSTASNLKYRRALKAEIATEFKDPSEEFVKMISGRVYSGRLTSSVKAEFAALTKAACAEFIRDRVNDRIQSAFESEGTPSPDPSEPVDPNAEPDASGSAKPGIVTTPEEWRAYRIVQAIGARITDPERIHMRDAKRYCAILFDDNNRRTICRLHFGARKKSIEVFTPDEEQRFELERISDIYKYSDAVTSAIGQYLDA
ncbi:type I restriction enzyme HsdR N-terminal domain-containing protein [Salinisphaera sp. Q1T1-3]|uniref:type I restriction enzyme HsdR N-terminal domain-containing protein n=1 Tax=Salinisphaera sp. Q1T1-3 TaxID=2321229 RepID=UPI000E72E101|nr:type I restriction enzyme HsdR N-terminal domain-containing protein [Salinisphaera sp. Q1T1-3]RJS92581.1 restriction endonuclease [Salinisphaera sp. Q1T1-3]